MLRCSLLAMLLALSGCAATVGLAADLHAASTVVLYTSKPPAVAVGCVMQNISEQFSDSSTSLSEGPGVEHREILMIGGQVPALVEVDPEAPGSKVLFHIPLPSKDRMEMAVRLTGRC